MPEEVAIQPKVLFAFPKKVTLWPGDILYVAGNPPVQEGEPGKPLYPFEHVAIAIEGKSDIDSDDELGSIWVYHLPESGKAGLGLRAASGWHYREFAEVKSGTLGHPRRVWNLGTRVFSSERDGEFCIQQFTKHSSVKKYNFTPKPPSFGRADQRGPQEEWNNCLGLVCNVLRVGRVPDLVKERYPDHAKYPDPYKPDDPDRDFPSPGHLARACTGKEQTPYCPADPGLAKHFSTAARTIEREIEETLTRVIGRGGFTQFRVLSGYSDEALAHLLAFCENYEAPKRLQDRPPSLILSENGALELNWPPARTSWWKALLSRFSRPVKDLRIQFSDHQIELIDPSADLNRLFDPAEIDELCRQLSKR